MRKAALEALGQIDSPAALAARAVLPRRIAASDERVVNLRLALKNYKPPDQLARLRKDVEERERKIYELSREKNVPYRKPRGNIGANVMSFGVAALLTGNPAHLISGALYGVVENKADVKAFQERKEQLSGEIAQLEELQQQDQLQIDKVMVLYQAGLPIDSLDAIRSIAPLLDAETSVDLLTASQSADDAQRLVATLLLGEEIAPLEERTTTLCRLLAKDPSPAIRQRAAISLSYIGDDHPAAAEALVGAIRQDPESVVRRWAIAALASFPGCAKTIVPAVQAALNDADDDVKCQATETLKTLGVPVA